MIDLRTITKVKVPVHAVNAAQLHMRTAGRRGMEGMALWVGHAKQEAFHVRECFIPEQEAINTGKGLLWRVNSNELHKLNLWMYERGYSLVAQLHSHPGDAYHSDTDDAYAIATKAGSLSLVIPDFARRPFSLDDCAVYRLSDKGIWEALPTNKAKELISVEQ